MRKVTEGVYVFGFKAGFMNFYAVDSPDGLIMIDTGLSDAMMQSALSQLAQHGRSASDIRHIVITHAHYDHCGGLNYLQRQVNARTYCHPHETLIVRGEQQAIMPAPASLGFPWRQAARAMTGNMPTAAPARVDAEISEGAELPGGWCVIAFPGHTRGQIGLWNADTRVLIGGDVMIHFPWGLGLPLRPATPDMDEAKRSIHKAGTLGIETLCLGHGRPIKSGAHDQIQRFADRL
jgi:glyoxylase-like metal-dependent hydrolase (beta-lactamase superfamily II)